MNQYAATTLITSLTSFVLIFLSMGNSRLELRKRELFVVSAAIIIFSSVAEFAGVMLDSYPSQYRSIHIILKVFELSSPPFLTMTLITVFNGYRHAEKLLPVAIINFFLEIYSSFAGFIFYIDEANVYHHYHFYWIYMVSYIICAVFFFFELLMFSRKYQNRNFMSLIAIILFLMAGLSLHSIKNEVRVDWLTLAMVAFFFYIYYSGLTEQMDSLTQLLDRKSYDMRIASLHYKVALVLFDIDYFKRVNDTFGHEAGDELLKRFAFLLKQIYGKYGLCYRIGGDEFCVIAKKIPDIEKVNSEFKTAFEKLCTGSEKMRYQSVSVGSTIFNPQTDNIADAIKKADVAMYEVKKENHKKY